MTMTITFQPISLDTRDDDSDALLVLSNGRLLAVATRLSHHHGRFEGSFYIEAAFGDRDGAIGTMFDSEDALAEWAEHGTRDAASSMPVMLHSVRSTG